MVMRRGQRTQNFGKILHCSNASLVKVVDLMSLKAVLAQFVFQNVMEMCYLNTIEAT